MISSSTTVSGVVLGAGGTPIISLGGSGPAGGSNNGLGGFGGSPDSTTHQQQQQNNPNNPANNSSNSKAGNTNMYSLKWNTQLLALQRSLANLWESGIGTDAVLLCQGTPLPVHKIILTAASPYVAAVVQTMASAAHMMPVIVVDIPSEAGKALLSFLYCGEAHVPVSIIPQLVAGAKFLGISGFGEPGVLESLTGMVPEGGPRAPSPTPSQASSIMETKSNRSTDSPVIKSDTDGAYLPQTPLPHIPPMHGVHLSTIPSPTPSTHSRRSDKEETRSRERSPYPPPPQFLESLKLTRVSPGNNPYKAASRFPPQQSPKGRIFLPGTSILDNLLKNPRARSEAPTPPNYDAPVNLSCSSNSQEAYEADGYAENMSGPGGGGLYYGGGHGGQYGEDPPEADNDEDSEAPIPAQLLEPNVEYHIGNEFSGERYGGQRGHIGLPLSIQNPLIDLAKVASAMQSHQLHQQQLQQREREQQQQHTRDREQQQQQGTPPERERESTRGIKRKHLTKNHIEQELISSSGRHGLLDPSLPSLPLKPIKPKKPQEAIICEICNKKFSNAYNLRVHMEGHSGQVFVCSVCSHASRSRDALRKHFAYRHRELWISGMSAFRSKSAPGRKLSISKSNSNSNAGLKSEEEGEPNNNNNNSLMDANGNINLNMRGGSDGTLTISEAFPQK